MRRRVWCFFTDEMPPPKARMLWGGGQMTNGEISGANMAAHQLRLVSDQDFLDAPTKMASPRVVVSMQQVLPLLVDAVRNNREWLNDFSDETLEVSSDLYEVLLAYKEMRRAA